MIKDSITKSIMSTIIETIPTKGIVLNNPRAKYVTSRVNENLKIKQKEEY